MDSNDLLPTLLALAAALLFSIGTQLSSLGLRYYDSRTGTLIDITVGAVLFWLFAGLFIEWSYWLTGAAAIFAAIGLFRPILSANLSTAGIRYLGPTLASALASTSPVFGAIFGIFILGEAMTWPLATGTVGILGAALLLTLGAPQGLNRQWPIWALGLPVAAAVLRAFSFLLTKQGLAIVPSAYFATLVIYTVSVILGWGLYFRRTERRPIRLHHAGFRWFVATGTCYAFAVLLLNTALQLGKIITVAPIVSISPLLSLMLSALIFKAETLNRRTVLAVFIVVPSVALIAAAR